MSAVQRMAIHPEMHLNSTTNRFAALLLAAACVVAMSGCQKEGPAETAGKKLDSAVESAAASVDEAAAKAGEKIEQAGDSIKDATRSDGK
jgi:ABC-type uncharacterized transport system auxiliary subunit